MARPVADPRTPREAPPGAHVVARAVNRADREVLVIEPAATIREAIELLNETGSCFAVVSDGDYVEGVVTHKSIVQAVMTHCDGSPSRSWLDGTVASECVEDWVALQDQDDLARAVDALSVSVMVGVQSDSQVVQALSYHDALKFYLDYTRPIFFIEKIELGLRLLLNARIPDGELTAAIDRTKPKGTNDEKATSVTLDMLTLETLVQVFINSTNYRDYFDGLFANRQAAASKLGGLSEFRNRVFHFRGDLPEGAVAKLEIAARLVTVFVRKELREGRISPAGAAHLIQEDQTNGTSEEPVLTEEEQEEKDTSAPSAI